MSDLGPDAPRLYANVRLDAPIPRYGPPGIADRLADFLTDSTHRSPVESAFAVTELSDEHRVVLSSRPGPGPGPLTLTGRAVAHGMPAFALRAEAGGRSLVYSGDTAPCAALTELAADCHLLLCEAEGDDPAHHTAEQTGETAAAARAGRLVVTHLGRALTPAEAVARAASRFAGPVAHADPGAVLTV